jgi:hypothetical protein
MDSALSLNTFVLNRLFASPSSDVTSFNWTANNANVRPLNNRRVNNKNKSDLPIHSLNSGNTAFKCFIKRYRTIRTGKKPNREVNEWSKCLLKTYVILSYGCLHLRRGFPVFADTKHIYEELLWSFPKWFIASLVPVYSQLTERGLIPSTPLQQLWMLPVLGTFLELLLWSSFQCRRRICLDVFNNLKYSSL